MQYKNFHSKLRHTIININITETNNLQIYNINISPIKKQFEYIFHTIIIRRPQSGRPKRYTCSHVSLLRPPQPKARSRGGRQFLINMKSVGKDNFQLTLFLSIQHFHITETHYYALFVPPINIWSFILPTNELLDFIKY